MFSNIALKNRQPGDSPYTNIASSIVGDFFNRFPVNPLELGAIPKTSGGVQFTLLTGKEATDVALLLIPDPSHRERHTVHKMHKVGEGGWRVFVSEAKAGDHYAFRVFGPYKPSEGNHYNPLKVVCDPFGQIGVPALFDTSLFVHNPLQPNVAELTDSLGHAPLSVVMPEDKFDWQGFKFLRERPATRLVLEAHVKGISKLLPGLDSEWQGTYRAFSHPLLLEALVNSGFTTIEFMPIHQGFNPDSRFWNYSTMNFFSPHRPYASVSDPFAAVDEVKTAVREMHRVGLEVILDVVYNHTVEGNHRGPTLCFRGIGNKEFYCLNPFNLAEYRNRSGTGNAINAESPLVILLIFMSIKYWHEVFGIDGVRLDLGSLLFQRQANNWYEFNPEALLFKLIEEELPQWFFLSTEPWTIDSYDLGRYSPRWAEWNGAYRDVIQRAVVDCGPNIGQLATRLSGSQDCFHDSRKAAYGQVVYANSHDSFVLEDRFSFSQRRNESNGEGNRDGHNPDPSTNSGFEGPTQDPRIVGLRLAMSRMTMSLVMLSAGIPMVTAADLILHSQGGNNNPYGQDNRTTWLDWENPRAGAFLPFVSGLTNLRRQLPALWSYHFGEACGWFTPSGSYFGDNDWINPTMNVLAFYISGESPNGVNRERGNDLYVAINFKYDKVDFTLPSVLNRPGRKWVRRLDCTLPFPFAPVDIELHKVYTLGAHGVLVLEAQKSA